MSTRREILQQGVALAAGLALPRHRIVSAAGRATAAGSFLDIQRQPDSIVVQVGNEFRSLAAGSNGRWENGRIGVNCLPGQDGTRLSLTSPTDGVSRMHLRWRGNLQTVRLLLGDAWERSYGDLEWRGFVPDRVMPWYTATWDGALTHCYGVRTGANAFCYWQADPQGISLWADVRSGGAALRLGERELVVAHLMSQTGIARQSPFTALRRFCHRLCPAPLLPAEPVYGHNDWYYAYGNNSATSVMVDCQNVVELSPTGSNRPFVVIDDGWQPERSADKLGVGLWDRGNERFPDMPGLADRIRQGGGRPGIWVRPLLATREAPDNWRLSRTKNILDPTVPGVMQKVADDIGRLHGWGYDLIKHDYSTFDIFGRWGSQMNGSPTRDGWGFAEGAGRTSAEVINALYATIRSAAGKSLIIGCNTVSHLSAGQFELCRIGDDTSGTEWGRVPKMGVNALAFRGVQHGAFYAADPDCIGVTNAIPWSLNRQWLELLSRSGTMTFVSLAPDALGSEQKRDVRAALLLAARVEPLAEPVDWQHTAWPNRWRFGGRAGSFTWTGDNGLDGPG